MDKLLNRIKKESYLLSEEEFEKVFDKLWNEMSQSFYKFEVEQYYKCDMNQDYYSFLKSDYSNLITSFQKFINAWPNEVKKKSNVTFKRLHIINLPLTEYLKYEMYFYLINEEFGEKIKCIDIKSTNLDTKKLADFIIFDNKTIIMNIHKNNGEYVCSYLYDKDKAIVKELVDNYNKLFKKADDYKEHADFDQSLINNMKDKDII